MSGLAKTTNISFLPWLLIALVAFAFPTRARSNPVQARNLQGTVHAYLALRSEEDKVVAVGDLFQVVRGDRVTAHVIFHFKDGSTDDETTVFSQRGTFHLISDHHIQKGPFFAHPMDMSIDMRTGQVTTRSADKDGKNDVKSEHMDLPPDLANGMVVPILENLPPGATDAGRNAGDTKPPETDVSMIVATPKPRLVKLDISRVGVDPFSLAGFDRKALHYQIKFDLGGVAGVVAPMIGKKPPDVEVWIEAGPMPTLVREEGPLAEGGPVVSIQVTGPELPGTKPQGAPRSGD